MPLYTIKRIVQYTNEEFWDIEAENEEDALERVADDGECHHEENISSSAVSNEIVSVED